MKRLVLILLLVSGSAGVFSQQLDINRMQQDLANASNDTLRLYILDSLSLNYSESNPDSSLFFADKEIKLAQQLNLPLNEAYAKNSKGYALLNMGNYPRALQTFLSAEQIAEDENNEKHIITNRKWVLASFDTSNINPENYRLQILGWIRFNLGILYENVNNPEKQFFNYSRALQIGEKIGSQMLIGTANMNLGRYYLSRGKPDSALIFEKKVYDLSLKMGIAEYNGSAFLNLARVYLAMGDKQQAISFFRRAIVASQKQNYIRGVIAANLALSDINMKEKNIDSGFYYANTALNEAIKLNLPDLLLRSYSAMTDYYTAVNKSDSIVKYQRLIIKIKDSVFNSTQLRQFQNIDFDEAQRRQELETAKKDYRDRLQKYILVAGLAVFLIIAVLLWRSNFNKQKANRLLKEQKQETDIQKVKVEKTLAELQATQSQLIHSAKMASLGELTAGIAHEIQNPLNFVNNFSDVNKELIEEANQELDKGKINEAKTILNDLKENQLKINQHGKRADAIVKGMLQHSRTSSGQKESADINALCEEYLRLATHGIRAKDKTFNAKIKTDFDNTIGKTNVVPQEIGRVVLNLINNAFYAVSERQKAQGKEFEPIVTIRTKKIITPSGAGGIEICVKDNGNGIPDAIKEKIFQPFFTTKPTGQGTGLGLSLSYDIIKAHGGEIKVETKVNEGTEFIIQLPT